MLSQISSRQFDEWRAYMSIYPVGAEALFLASSQIVATLLNTNRKKGSAAIRVSDIKPDFLDAARKSLQSAASGQPPSRNVQTAEQQIFYAQMWTAYLGGQDLRGQDGG